MVSIPHYEDLSAKEILESLDLKWWASEKLDGSFLEAGLDQWGHFYTSRKGGERMYHASDWPKECWATTYRIAHDVASMLVEALYKEGAIAAGQHFGAEIIEGNRPNTVTYTLPDKTNGLLVLTTVSYQVSTTFYSVVENFVAHLRPDVIVSFDGKTISRGEVNQTWKVRVNTQYSRELIAARLTPSAQKVRTVLEMWLPQESKVQGFTIMEVLDISLAKKHPNCGDRNWNDLRKELKREREELREVFTSLVLLFKEIAYKVLVFEMPSVVGAGSQKEGVVVTTPNGMFKIVDRPSFSSRNLFVHRIKYMLVGGRRPARSSFLSRTKHWTTDAKLARIDVLLKRYQDWHVMLRNSVRYNGHESHDSYSGSLHQRMLNLFADTRKRIENGRQSISGDHPSDQATGD